MNLGQIQKSIFESDNHFDCIGLGEDRLVIPSEYGLEGVYSSILLAGEKKVLIKHPAIIYDNPGQKALFLDYFKSTEEEHHDMEFADDPYTKSIVAIRQWAVDDEEAFMRTINSKILDLVYAVKKIRTSLAKQIWDTVAPTTLSNSIQSLMYLSLMQDYDAGDYGYSMRDIMPIDWNDIRTRWKHSSKVTFLPIVKSDNPETFYDKVMEQCAQYMEKGTNSAMIFFGFPSIADASKSLLIQEIRGQLHTSFACHTLWGYRNLFTPDASYTALITIFNNK